MASPFLWNGNSFVEALRNTIGDPEAQSTRWSTPTLVGYGNRAQQQLVLDTEIAIETQWETTLVDGQLEYKMPENFIQDRRTEYFAAADDVRCLQRLNQADYDSWFSRNPTVTGEPTMYYFWRKLGEDLGTYQPTSIFLIPTPDVVAEGNTLKVWGYKLPDEMHIDSLWRSLEFHPAHCEALVLYAASLVKLDDGEETFADRLTARYESQVMKIKDVLARKSRADIPRMRPRSSVLLTSSRPMLPWKRGY
jgi:hypothetical protein